MLYEKATVVEIVTGREALWGIKNANLIPLGGAITLRNATLTEQSFRTGGGATKVGTPPVAAKALVAFEYSPAADTYRNVVMLDDGSIWKDNGLGTVWTQLKTGLTVNGAVPMFCEAGAESSGRNKRLFYADGINQPMYLDGDGVVMVTMNLATQQALDWNGNPPNWFAVHDGYLWAGGCKSVGTASVIYRSTVRTDHSDFRSATTYSFPVFSGQGNRIVQGLSFKGGLVLFKIPNYAYFFDTTSASSADWHPTRVAEPGGTGPSCAAIAEDDVVWVSQDGSVHLLSAAVEYGSVHATDLAYRKLGNYVRENFETSNLDRLQVGYYSQAREFIMSISQIGQTTKNRRLHMDFNRRQDQGERWITWDRDRNEAFFLRRVSGVLRPHWVDHLGQIWQGDTDSRAWDNGSWDMEWRLKDDDFSSVVPAWHGRKKNLRFIQIEYFPHSATTHTITIYRDGRASQSIVVDLANSGALLGSATLPFMLGVSSVSMSVRRRLLGQCVRFGVGGVASGTNSDVSIMRILVGMELAG